MLHLATEISTHAEKLVANAERSARRIIAVRSYGTYGRDLLRQLRSTLTDTSLECVDVTSTAHLLYAASAITVEQLPKCDAVIDLSPRGARRAATIAALLGVPIITTMPSEKENEARNILQLSYQGCRWGALHNITVMPHAGYAPMQIDADSERDRLNIDIPDGGATLTIDDMPHATLQEGDSVSITPARLHSIHLTSEKAATL